MESHLLQLMKYFISRTIKFIFLISPIFSYAQSTTSLSTNNVSANKLSQMSVSIQNQEKSSQVKRICTATLNSDNEKKVLEKKLLDQGYEFIELTDYASNKESKTDDWMLNACQAKVQCDILLISGHFGQGFFGENGWSLPLGKLEEYSCSNICDGILKKPKQVYLMGCNTLAGKDSDFRTPEDYYQALMSHNIPSIEAQQIVAARYSPLGFSNIDKMRRVFNNVPILFGFNSVGPSGKNIENSFQQYVQSFNMGHVISGNVPISEQVQKFRKFLKNYRIETTNGILDSSPEFAIKQNMCVILSDQDLGIRLKLLNKSLKESTYQYVSTAAQILIKNIFPILKSNSKENLAKLTLVKESIPFDQNIMDKLALLLKDSFNPGTTFEILQILKSLNWINWQDFDKNIQNLIEEQMKRNTTSSIDSICSMIIDYPYVRKDLNLTELILRQQKNQNLNQIRLWSCLLLNTSTQQSQEVRKILLQKVLGLNLNQLDPMQKMQVISILIKIAPESDELKTIIHQIEDDSISQQYPFLLDQLNVAKIVFYSENQLNQLLTSINLTEDNYDQYFEAFKYKKDRSDQLKLFFLNQKTKLCLQNKMSCYLFKEFDVDPTFYDLAVHQAFSRNNSMLIQSISQQLILRNLSSNGIRSTIANSLTLIFDLLEDAQSEEELRLYSYFLLDQKLSLSQLMKVQKYYLRLNKPKKFGYYLAKKLYENRIILPFLVSLESSYFIEIGEQSKTNLQILSSWLEVRLE